eukprot:gene37071-44995_t
MGRLWLSLLAPFIIKQRSDVVTVLAEVKNEVRIDGHDLLLSSLANVCMLKCLLKSVDHMLFFTSDDVSECFNDGSKPHVITTKKALEWLKEHKLAVSTKSKKQKKRVITYNVTFGARDGQRLCVVIKVADTSMPILTSSQSELSPFETNPFYLIVASHHLQPLQAVERTGWHRQPCRLVRSLLRLPHNSKLRLSSEGQPPPSPFTTRTRADILVKWRNPGGVIAICVINELVFLA